MCVDGTLCVYTCAYLCVHVCMCRWDSVWVQRREGGVKGMSRDPGCLPAKGPVRVETAPARPAARTDLCHRAPPHQPRPDEGGSGTPFNRDRGRWKVERVESTKIN